MRRSGLLISMSTTVQLVSAWSAPKSARPPSTALKAIQGRRLFLKTSSAEWFSINQVATVDLMMAMKTSLMMKAILAMMAVCHCPTKAKKWKDCMRLHRITRSSLDYGGGY